MFETECGNSYLVERTLEEIATVIYTPAPTEAELEEIRKKEEEEERLRKEAEERAAEEAAAAKGKKGAAAKAPPKKVEEAPAEEEKADEEEKPPEPEPSPAEAKAALKPPQDPFGEQVLHQELLYSEDELRDRLHSTMQKFLSWIFMEKSNNLATVKRNGKDLIDASVDELDENLRA